jgi:hypothetical protein
MTRRAAVSDMVLPLLTWSENAELHQLALQRADLADRVAKLAPHSVKRILAEDRLRGVTARKLELECRLRKRGQL